MSLRQVVGASIIALLLLFVAFNLQPARIWAYGIRVEMPIAFVVIFSAIMGSGATLLFAKLRKPRSAKQR